MRASGPALRGDLAIVEQVYRNEKSFVVKEPATGKYYRFRPVEVQVMRLFDGMRSAADVADALLADGVRVSAATVSGFARQLSKLGLLEATLRERTTQPLQHALLVRQPDSPARRGVPLGALVFQPELRGRVDRALCALSRHHGRAS